MPASKAQGVACGPKGQRLHRAALAKRQGRLLRQDDFQAFFTGVACAGVEPVGFGQALEYFQRLNELGGVAAQSLYGVDGQGLVPR